MARSNQMMMPLLIGGGAAIAVYLYTQSGGTPAPLSIYPEYAYTAQTSMAASPSQHATTKAPVVPTALFAATQAQEQSALYSQCAGSYPGCTPLLSDTQLGF